MDEASRLLHPIPEAYRQLGIGRTTFFELVAAGEIEVVKIGRRTLVPQASLRDFVERLRASAAGRGGASTEAA